MKRHRQWLERGRGYGKRENGDGMGEDIQVQIYFPWGGRYGLKLQSKTNEIIKTSIMVCVCVYSMSKFRFNFEFFFSTCIFFIFYSLIKFRAYDFKRGLIYTDI